jgi:hypothetical protein
MQPKLILNFERLSEADFQTKAGLIIAVLTGNPRFPEPWPTPAPALATLSVANDSYRNAYHASRTQDSVQIGRRNESRLTLTAMLRQLAPYLEFVAHGDTAALASTGYDLRRDAVRTSSFEPLLAPKGFKVQHGPHRGSLAVRVNRVAGAGSYEVQITQGDPTQDAGWQHALTALSSTRIILSDLPLLQSLWIRVRAIGIAGAGLWTAPVHIVVV